MNFELGQIVEIKKLKKRGTIIEKISATQYKVEIGSLTLNCKASDLSEACEKEIKKDQSKKQLNQVPPVDVIYKKSKTKTGDPQAKTIDLHGMRVHEAMELVAKTLDTAILENKHQLEIIHGIGEGKIKSALHSYLAKLKVIKQFRLDIGNSGITRVYF